MKSAELIMALAESLCPEEIIPEKMSNGETEKWMNVKLYSYGRLIGYMKVNRANSPPITISRLRNLTQEEERYLDLLQVNIDNLKNY